MATQIKKVCLVGANGSLGSVILDTLVKAGSFDVSVLIRANSTSEPAHSASLTKIPTSPKMTLEELEQAVAGQDAVIAAFPLKDVNQHLRLAEAAARAGVKRFIPADYGSCDAASAQAQKHLKLYRDKHAVQQRCEELAVTAKEGEFTWTSIVSGHFFDWGVEHDYLHIDLETQTMLILDDGMTKASASTLVQVSRAVVKVLQKPAETQNRFVFVQSFCPTPLEVFAAFERATGKVWKKQSVNSNGYLDRESEKLAAGDEHALHNIVFVLGQVDADWTKRDEFAMDLLELEEENLDVIVKQLVEEYNAKSTA